MIVLIMLDFLSGIFSQVLSGVMTAGVLAAISIYLRKRYRDTHSSAEPLKSSARSQVDVRQAPTVHPSLAIEESIATSPSSTTSHSRSFPESLPVSSVVVERDLASQIEKLLGDLPRGDGPRAIVIGRKGKAPRTQVFTGNCTEADVARIRSLLTERNDSYQASIVADSAQYKKYRTTTARNPKGYTGLA